ncbi:MAG TPA: YdeI/OmpD-associated family protein [Anaeromyxobacteraceae bacterium]|nr:YdeI/OmpD-associated family protein [Anaeromyxobacteraceae bacterium]
MAPVVPDPRRIRAFESEAAFETWLATHHDTEPEVWITIHKKSSGFASVTPAQALDVALCWGWIDGIRKGFDERSFLQRYTPRRRKSTWSQINREHVARLAAAGRMTPYGQRQVDAAKADGRWDAAYAPIRATTESTVPSDLRAAIQANPRARRTFRTLGRLNLFALAFRTNAMKTPAGRARKIATLVAMLARGETIVPNPSRPPPKAAARHEPPGREPRASARRKPPRRGPRPFRK